MYRLLTNPRATVDNLRYAFQRPLPSNTAFANFNNNSCIECNQSRGRSMTFWFLQTHSSPSYCYTSPRSFNRQRPSRSNKEIRRSNSTIVPTIVLEKLANKRTKTAAKYVELLQVTNNSIEEMKTPVKRCKAGRLQNLIMQIQKQQVSLPNSKKLVKKRTRKKSKLIVAQPIEYRKLNLSNIECAPMLDSCQFDEIPMLFFGKANSLLSNPSLLNSNDVQDIWKSFENFKDIIQSLQEEKSENSVYGLNSNLMLEDKLQVDPTINIDCEDSLFSDPTNRNTKSSAHNATILPELDVKNNQSILNNDIKKDALLLTKRKTKFRTKVYANEEQERLAKEHLLRQNLIVYLYVCVSVGHTNRALSTLLNYREKTKKVDGRVSFLTIDLYNILLQAYADRGIHGKISEILQYIEEDKLQLNEQSFVAMLTSLNQSLHNQTSYFTENERLGLIEKYIKKAEVDYGFTLHQVMENSKFIGDQRCRFVKVIRSVRPDFQQQYTLPNLFYSNRLLNRLNDGVVENCANTPIEKDHTNNANDFVEGMYQQLKMNKTQSNKATEEQNSVCIYTLDKLREWAREQLAIELDGSITIKSIVKPNENFDNSVYEEKIVELEKEWRATICNAVSRELNAMKAQMRQKPNGTMSYYIYLKTLDIKDIADILIKEIFKISEGSESFSPTVGLLYRELGNKVQQKFQVEIKKSNGVLQKVGDVYNDYCEIWKLNQKDQGNSRQIWQRLIHKHRPIGPSLDISEIRWPPNVLAAVGRFLYNILIRDIKIDAFIMRHTSKRKQEEQPKESSNYKTNPLPAFYTLFRNHGRFVREEIKPHPVLVKLLRASRRHSLTFDSTLVPMLCPPKPWSGPYNGGYLLNQSDLLRLPNQAIQQWERINNMPLHQLYPAIDTLNQLGRVPWRINTTILDVIISVFQDGGDESLDVPQAPHTLLQPTTDPDRIVDLTIQERSKLFKEKMYHRRKQAEMYSLWCDTLYRLSLANHYRDRVFWLPHNMDFRGRVYPIPPHLNHIGSDLARSLLVFDKSQPLGVDGFSWLKLHCINLTGLKKRESITDRLLFAEQIMPEILDSAENPLNGRRWWTKSDEPWQTLSCCMEIAKVLKSNEPVEEFRSHFPIHQDGSCNGLQHYAALGRDEAGARSVNLMPSVLPQDVYSSVVTLVEKTRQTDAQNGLQVAIILDGFVKRKVIKQTVMTTVYGVTRYGARLQIARQLKDNDNFPKEWVWPASTYLTVKTFESLREMFTSTREIQDWFTECARLISNVCLKNVEWVTPLGLPVVQPYTRQECKLNMRASIISTEGQGADLFEKPNVMKQKNAFPPNFIHSLDSSHMMLTSLNCERAGLTFMSVHDCFWTHANTVPDMNRICREQFIALHSEAILEDLAQYLKNKFIGENYNLEETLLDNIKNNNLYSSRRRLLNLLNQVPLKGKYDLQNILKSVYFFS